MKTGAWGWQSGFRLCLGQSPGGSETKPSGFALPDTERLAVCSGSSFAELELLGRSIRAAPNWQGHARLLGVRIRPARACPPGGFLIFLSCCDIISCFHSTCRGTAPDRLCQPLPSFSPPKGSGGWGGMAQHLWSTAGAGAAACGTQLLHIPSILPCGCYGAEQEGWLARIPPGGRVCPTMEMHLCSTIRRMLGVRR